MDAGPGRFLVDFSGSMMQLHFPTAAAQARVVTTNINGPISQRWLRFVSTPPVGLQNDMVAYETHPARYDNPLEFWRNFENSFPTLAKLARMCLGVMGSNTPSETEFKTLRPLFANANPMTIATMIHQRQMYQKNVI